MKKGIIRLIRDELQLHHARYEGRYERKKIIEHWMKLYDFEDWDKMNVQIAPDVSLNPRTIQKELDAAINTRFD